MSNPEMPTPNWQVAAENLAGLLVSRAPDDAAEIVSACSDNLRRMQQGIDEPSEQRMAVLAGMVQALRTAIEDTEAAEEDDDDDNEEED